MTSSSWRVLACWLCLSIAAPWAAAASVVKWVDEHGNVHYGDRGGNEATLKSDAAGRSAPVVATAKPAAKIEPTTPPRQVTEVGPLRSPEEQIRRDRALLGSFTSEDDIDRARDRTLGTLEAELGLARNAVKILAEQKRSLETERAASPGKMLAAERGRELADIEAQLQGNSRFIAQKQEQFTQSTARFEQDKQRWRVLKGEGAR